MWVSVHWTVSKWFSLWAKPAWNKPLPVRREHAAKEALFKETSSAPLGPQFTADFLKQRAITKRRCSSASFSELILLSRPMRLQSPSSSVSQSDQTECWSALVIIRPEVCHDHNGFQRSLNAWKMLRNYSSSKVKMFTCPIVFLLTFYHNFISLFFFFSNNSHDPSSMQTRTILRRELQEVYYVMKQPEQRTSESLTCSSSKKPENYRVSLFFPNSWAALAKTAGFMVETVFQKCKKTDAHNVYMTHLKCSKTRFRIFLIKV